MCMFGLAIDEIFIAIKIEAEKKQLNIVLFIVVKF